MSSSPAQDPLSERQQELLPPPYTQPPQAVKSTVSTYTQLVSLQTDTQKFEFGKFVSGDIIVKTASTTQCALFVVDIVCQEAAVKQASAPWKSDRFQRRVTVVNRIQVPCEGPLEAQMSYKFPFSIQFPTDWSGIDCKNGYEHCTLPPTLGASSDPYISPFSVSTCYYLLAYMAHRPESCSRKNMHFMPRVTLLPSLDNFTDENGDCLDRMHKSSAQLTQGFRKKRVLGEMELRAMPFIHNAAQPYGVAKFTMEIKPLSDELDWPSCTYKASYAIYKIITSSPDGMGGILGKTKNRAVTKYRICSGVSNISLVWNGFVAELSVPYETCSPGVLKSPSIAPSVTLLQAPSVVSCFSAQTYEFEVTVVTKFGTCKLAVPLLNHYGDSSLAPRYEELADLQVW